MQMYKIYSFSIDQLQLLIDSILITGTEIVRFKVSLTESCCQRLVITVEFEPIELIRDLMHAIGINFHRLQPPYDGISGVDGGLRGQIYVNFEYSALQQYLKKTIGQRSLHILTDTFESRYIVLTDPRAAKPDGETFIVIGPYLTRAHQDILNQVLASNELPAFQNQELTNYYCGVPVITEYQSVESEVIILARYVFGGNEFEIIRSDQAFNFSIKAEEIIQDPDNKLSMAMVEERYKSEDEFMEAIERGDLQNALLHMSAFRKFSLLPRNTDLLRNYKNFIFVLNTLLRKAVQRAEVHPAYIDKVSSSFAMQIEAIRAVPDLSRLSDWMLRKYCLLVQNHSLRGYTKPIQRVINYISFHLDEPLPLRVLAEVAMMNASNLSTLFKKEAKITLTEFINQKRIQQSLVFLNTTELPIYRIAEKVGILDENYFSRVFRQQIGKSPRDYRKSIVKD